MDFPPKDKEEYQRYRKLNDLRAPYRHSVPSTHMLLASHANTKLQWRLPSSHSPQFFDALFNATFAC